MICLKNINNIYMTKSIYYYIIITYLIEYILKYVFVMMLVYMFFIKDLLL